MAWPSITLLSPLAISVLPHQDRCRPVPTGRQILAAGLDDRDDFTLCAILPSGDFEDVSLNETFDLRRQRAARFVAFRTDRDFKLTLNDRQLIWGQPTILGDPPAHPGYPNKAAHRITKARLKNSAYPRKGMFRSDRVRSDGEILQRYAGHKVGEEWIISFYSPFTQGWNEMPEMQFVTLQIATALDIKSRAGQSSNPRRI
jgi:hypothetical protein